VAGPGLALVGVTHFCASVIDRAANEAAQDVL
jgi:hypothetical protein